MDSISSRSESNPARICGGALVPFEEAPAVDAQRRNVNMQPAAAAEAAACGEGAIRKLSLACVIIGTPGDGESTKPLSHATKTSLDQQFSERRPEFALRVWAHYTSPKFLSFGLFGGSTGSLFGAAFRGNRRFITGSLFGAPSMLAAPATFGTSSMFATPATAKAVSA